MLGDFRFPVAPRSSPEEKERVIEEQASEQGWWKDAPRMQTSADIQKAIESGSAVPVPNAGEGYALSPGVRDEFKALGKATFALLQDIAKQWQIRARQRDVNAEVYLRITSLARTVEYQMNLIEQGYPGAVDSTHVKLGAFDILSSWLEQNRPDLLTDLDAILEPLMRDGQINWIKEPEVGAYHIALNPSNIH